MYGISKEQYEHNTALMLETDWGGGPFSGPPANVPSNISNGALGFFSANAVSSKSVEIYLKQNKTSKKNNEVCAKCRQSI